MICKQFLKKEYFALLLIPIHFLNFSFQAFGQGPPQYYWEVQESGTTEDLNGVYFIDDQNGWVVGARGTILKTTDGGRNWDKKTSNTLSTLYSVDFFNQSSGYAVGSNGTILRTNNSGDSWVSQNSGTTGNITDVFSDRTTTSSAWAIGAEVTGFKTKILTTNVGGSNWNEISLGEANPIRIFHLNSMEGWVITWSFANGDPNIHLIRIFKTNDNWSTDPILQYSESVSVSAITPRFRDIQVLNGQIGWVVGDKGKLLKTTNSGMLWQPINSGITNDLKRVFFTSPTNGWVIEKISDTKSVIRRSTDGGNSWENNCLDLNEYFLDFHFPNNNYGWAVGTSGTIVKMAPVSELPAALAGDDLTVCESEAQLSAVALPPPITGRWTSLYPGIFFSNENLANSKISGLSPGTHQMIWTTYHPLCGAYDQDTVSVTLPLLPEADAGGDFTVCLSEAELDSWPVILPNPISGVWTTNPATSVVDDTALPAKVSALIPGENHLTWTLSHPTCPNYSQDEVIVYYEDGIIAAMKDIYYPASEPVISNITDNDLFPDPLAIKVSIIADSINPNVGTVEWDPTGNIKYTPPDSTVVISRIFTYRIEHTSCPELYDEATVKFDFTKNGSGDEKEDLSLVFSPNGDGFNDRFVIPELEERPGDFPHNSLIVINRWGDVVYKAQPYDNTWDGTHWKTGKDLPPGTYFYIARLHIADGIVRKERVSLIR